jgi:superfamily II DNA or RNA helicase
MIDLKKTLSLSFYRQKCGRVLRPEYAEGYDLETQDGRLAAIRNSKKPHAIILDMVGNYETHSFPDEEIQWSLDGKSARETEKSIPTKECPKCYNVDRGFVKICSSCGYEFKVEARTVEITHSDEELVEVDLEKERRERRQAQSVATTKEELVALGIKNGYKNPYKWAEYVLKGREEKARKFAASRNRGENGS